MSLPLPPWSDKRSASPPPMTTAASETPGDVSTEKCYLPSSPRSVAAWKPRALRHVHCITNGEGLFLVNLIGDTLKWDRNPINAAVNDHAWLSSTVALAALRRLREQQPDQPLGIALVTMRLRFGGWQLVHVQEFGIGTLNTQPGGVQ